MTKKNRCALCIFCTFEHEQNDFICHNQKSKRFGDKLSNDEMKKACPDFEPHNYDMSIKDALKYSTVANKDSGIMEQFNQPITPQNGFEYAAVTFMFKDNIAMSKFLDARARLFIEYMSIAEKEGDFEK